MQRLGEFGSMVTPGTRRCERHNSLDTNISRRHSRCRSHYRTSTAITLTARREHAVSQITARVPRPVVEALDAAAAQLRRSRAQVVREALERYLEDYDDLAVALERLRDPTDPVLDWDEVRRDLLDTD